MESEYFVKIQNPKHTRKQLLQVGRLSILTLRNQQEVTKMRVEKQGLIKELQQDIQRIEKSMDALNSLLPQIDLSEVPEKKKPNLPKIKPKPQKEEKKPKKQAKPKQKEPAKKVKYTSPGSKNLNSEVERLEYTLNKIENTIKNLDD